MSLACLPPLPCCIPVGDAALPQPKGSPSPIHVCCGSRGGSLYQVDLLWGEGTGPPFLTTHETISTEPPESAFGQDSASW